MQPFIIDTHGRFWQLQMDYLLQMQNSFAGELSLPQALRDLTNVVPGSLNLDWQAVLSFQLERRD